MKTLIVFVISFLVAHNVALAKDGFFNVKGTRVSLYGARTPIGHEIYDKIFEIAKKANFEDITVTKEMRPQILKELGIEDSDFVYRKVVDQGKTLSYKVSDLKIIVSINTFGVSESLGDIALELPKIDNESFVAIGKSNPFNETGIFKKIESNKGIYVISSKVSFIEKITQTEEQKKRQKEHDLLVGNYKFLVQAGKAEPILAENYDIDTDSNSNNYFVYGGEVLSNGATLIRMSGLRSCGFYIIVKDKDLKTSSSPCGAMGC